MTNDRPNCPNCTSPLMKNGKTKAGYQRYRCSCGFSKTDSPNPHGSPMVNDKPMNGRERQARYREKKKLQKPIDGE